jgi:AcrR family transcriptional regulator
MEIEPERHLMKRSIRNRLPVMPKPLHREKLLEAGFDVVLERGYCGASVRDIVSAADVPEGSFTNHFASKDAFCLELLNRYFTMVEDNIRVTLRNDADSPLARLEKWLDIVIGFSIQSRGLMASIPRATRSARCAQISICSAGVGAGPQSESKGRQFMFRLRPSTVIVS